MGKALFKIIFWHNIFICKSIFKIFVTLPKTFGMQNGDMVIIFLRLFFGRKVTCLKNAVSRRWCIDNRYFLLDTQYREIPLVIT